jgi:hypothetical protein
MLDVKIDVQEGISQELKKISRELNRVPAEGLKQFVALTPVKSGRARRSTTLKNSNTIHANYPYAQRLDSGWSDQAPQGMTRPFDKWLKSRLDKIFGR